jgi:glycosyltransferase involved in cell wall biosynthesis
MRILFSTDQVYLHGGIEKVMAEKANYFSDVLGYEVYILTTEQKQKPACYALSPKVRLVDINVNYTRAKSYFHPANLKKIFNHLRSWKKVIGEIRPDVIISCNYAFDFYWLPFSFRGIRKFKEYHSSGFLYHQPGKSGMLKKIKFMINDFIESKFDSLILLNPDEKQFYRTSNLTVIPNSIEIPEGLHARLDSKRVIAAGRIAGIKGFDTLIAAWKSISENAPDWHLDIFGQGEPQYIATLQSQIDKSGLSDKIHIRKATPDLQKEMLNSSIYAMTSVSECYPMVLLEAASIGLPVVTFDCPTGPRHIVTDGVNGFLVRNQDVEAFSEKILSLVRDEDLLRKTGERAKADAQRFSNEAVIQQWVSLFNKSKNEA